MKASPNLGITFGFAAFAVIFGSFLTLRWLFPALVTAIAFGAAYALYYHTVLDVPDTEEERAWKREWLARLEDRWKTLPPAVRDLEYYIKHAPLNPYAVIAFIAFGSYALLVMALKVAVWLITGFGI
jgi:hypothetical protein